MPRRIRFIPIAVPFMVMYALAPARVGAQTPAQPVPPDNPFVERTTTPDNPFVEPDTRPPARDERASATREHATESPPAPDDRPPPELARVTTGAQPAGPTSEAAMRALDAVLTGDGRDPIAGMDHAAAAASDGGGGIPSRTETAAAIAEVTPAIRACATDQAGDVLDLRIVFGSSGRVTIATLASPSTRLSPRQRTCIARAVRRARISAFERARFEVIYPVRL